MEETVQQLRWRISHGQLPLIQRHIRSLLPLNLPQPLAAWLQERLDQLMQQMLAERREGVLVIDLDLPQELRVSVEDPRPLPQLTMAELDAEGGWVDGVHWQGKPLEGTVWAEHEARLYVGAYVLTTATGTLAFDLAQTLGYPVEFVRLRREMVEEAVLRGGAFVINDEFGLVPIGVLGEDGLLQERVPSAASLTPATDMLITSFERLWAR